MTSPGLDAYLATLPNRCAHLYAPNQGCPTCTPVAPDLGKAGAAGANRKRAVIAAVSDAAPLDVRDRIDAAILAVAARGEDFSANDVRDLFPESGGIVGARFNALARRHGWQKVGHVASSKANTNGHEIGLWRTRGAA